MSSESKLYLISTTVKILAERFVPRLPHLTPRRSIVTSKSTTCPACLGKPFLCNVCGLRFAIPSEHIEKRARAAYWRQCEICNGTGQVPAEQPTDVRDTNVPESTPPIEARELKERIAGLVATGAVMPMKATADILALITTEANRLAGEREAAALRLAIDLIRVEPAHPVIKAAMSVLTERLATLSAYPKGAPHG
jgi:hypothetical protein